jgi:methyl-galactoside transport system ATP-binding protein
MGVSEYILEMNGISKNFPGVKALDDVTIKVKPGTVHALMGENGAGKSTLMKCLFGIYSPDEGEILLDGKPARFATSRQALDSGISMIHQELLPVPFRPVMENLWLGRVPVRKIGPLAFVDNKRLYDDTVGIFKSLGMEIDPKTWVRNLSVSKIQSLEIAKAVSYNSRVIIMDEPTSSLTENEVAQLFKIIRELKSKGVAIIYISHKMEEILAISDEVSVMRDGRHVGTYPAKDLTTDMIISKMVGRDLTHRFPPRANTPSDVVLKVEHLFSAESKSFKDISFELRRGEILGIGGLVGAKRTELVESIFGLRKIESGTIHMEGKPVVISSPQSAISRRMALLTEERRATGIVPMLSILENTILANLHRYVGKLGLIDEKRCSRDVYRSIEQLKVKTPSPRTRIKDLSGGNQQKVLFARWLLTEPDILILDEPTRGIDVGAKYEIYTIIADLAAKGKSILMISSEMPELLGMSDRIMVMCDGRLTGILDGKSANQEKIMRLATQFM